MPKCKYSEINKDCEKTKNLTKIFEDEGTMTWLYYLCDKCKEHAI